MQGDRRQERYSLLLGFAIGSLTAGVLGLFAWLLTRTRSNLGQSINIYNALPGSTGQLDWMRPQLPAQPMIPNTRQLTNSMQLSNGVSLSTKTDTITLPTTESVRVFNAPFSGPFWLVRLHVIGPAGGFASFAVDSSAFASGGSSVVIPAGRFTEMRIGPRQSISGIAGGANTQVSYTASAEVV